MEKPIDLLIIDTKEEIIKKFNETNLPLSIISMILHEINNMVDKQLETQILLTRQQYNKELEKEDK